MDYKRICDIYSALEETTKGLEKTKIIANFLEEAEKLKEYDLIYLLQGKVFADYDKNELGMSLQLVIRAISRAYGLNDSVVIDKFKEFGDLGLAAEKVSGGKKQTALFSNKLTVEKVTQNLRKIPTLEGQGTVDKKIGLVVELLNSATPREARYIIRTVLGDLKVGVGNGLLRDAIVEHCFKPEGMEEKKEKVELVQQAYDKVTDFAEVFEKSCKGKLDNISLSPGRPLKVMLFPKAKDVEDAFRIVGRPAAFEYKYDGFRMMINKEESGEIKIFTRRLEEVTHQFPDVVEYVKKNVKAKTFIIDCEAVGFNPKTKSYVPFQYISQRIKRKYEIERLIKELPVELEVFDILFYDGKSYINEHFDKRRKLIEKIVKQERWKIVLSNQIISSDAKEVEEFYEKALDEGQEGLMAKSLSAIYKPGARVGYAVKLKPEDEDIDLVITGAEWGTGKRAGWLTSFDVSCIDRKTNELKEIGKVSTGLKEKEEQGLTFREMTKILERLVIGSEGRRVRVKPEVIVSVQYQNIQKSPTYSSGFALRFPRITRLRPDKGIDDVAELKDIKKEASPRSK